MRYEIGYTRRPGLFIFTHRVELGMVPALGAPISREVVCHEIEVVEIFGSHLEVDIVKDCSACRQGCSQSIVILR